jgi:acylphosphatase
MTQGAGAGVIGVRVRIRGRVQGVSFRAWTRAEAEARGLSGWVRNEPDGSVTALIAGRAAAVRDMVAALHQGPPRARVDRVEGEDAEAPETPGFHLLR